MSVDGGVVTRSLSILPSGETTALAVECCRPVTAADVTPEDSAVLASLFKALSDPHRVRIVNHLANADEPVCVCDFQPLLGLSQGTVSFHLKKLLTVGLISREQRGTWAYYSLNRAALGRLAGVFDMEGDRS